MAKPPARMHRVFEQLLLQYNFQPDPHHRWNVERIEQDLLHERWRRQERIEEGDKLTPYSLRIHFDVDHKGLPKRMHMWAYPQMSAHSKNYIVVKGSSKIILYFADIVDAFVKLQRIHKMGARDKILKPLADRKLKEYADRQH